MADTDLLRQAAAKLRDHARAAMPGPWESLDGGDRLVAWKLDPTGQFDDAFDYVVDEPISNDSNAAFIALMHPPVALALADLLEEAATYAGISTHLALHATASAVARAVLREEAGNDARH